MPTAAFFSATGPSPRPALTHGPPVFLAPHPSSVQVRTRPACSAALPGQWPTHHSGAVKSENDASLRVPGHGGSPLGRETRCQNPEQQGPQQEPTEWLAGGMSHTGSRSSLPLWKEASSREPAASCWEWHRGNAHGFRGDVCPSSSTRSLASGPPV